MVPFEAVAVALERHLLEWYRRANGRPPTAAELRSIAVYSHDVDARVRNLFGDDFDDLNRVPPQSILDTGCGYGSIPVYLAARFPAAKIFATDVTDHYFWVGQAAAADLGLKNIEFAVADLRSLPRDRRFDFVMSCNMLNFMASRADLERGVAALASTLADQGRLFIHTPHFWSVFEPFTGIPFLQFLPRRWQSALARWSGRRSTLDDNRHPSLREIAQILARHGCRIRNVTPSSVLGRLRRSHITLWAQH